MHEPTDHGYRRRLDLIRRLQLDTAMSKRLAEYDGPRDRLGTAAHFRLQAAQLPDGGIRSGSGGEGRHTRFKPAGTGELDCSQHNMLATLIRDAC